MKTIDYKNIKALLLDLDGTLINSEKAFCNSFKKVLLNRYNINITLGHRFFKRQKQLFCAK